MLWQIALSSLQWRHNGSMAFQITSLTIVYSTVYSGADQRKHQSSASLAFVRGINRGPVNFHPKWPVTRKTFPLNDVIMFMQGGAKPHRARISQDVLANATNLLLSAKIPDINIIAVDYIQKRNWYETITLINGQHQTGISRRYHCLCVKFVLDLVNSFYVKKICWKVMLSIQTFQNRFIKMQKYFLLPIYWEYGYLR